MNDFVHQRHKPPTSLEQPRDLIVACASMCSNVNLSRILRTAGCCGISQVICCGAVKVIDKIARDGADTVELRVHRTLPHPLLELKHEAIAWSAWSRRPIRRRCSTSHSNAARCSSWATSGRGWMKMCCDCWMPRSRSRSTACRTATTSPRPRQWPCTNTAGSSRGGSGLGAWHVVAAFVVPLFGARV